MYDIRKNKVVTYNSDGFTVDKAKHLVDKHTLDRNRKLEVFNDSDYQLLVVNSSIDEKKENEPQQIFKI